MKERPRRAAKGIKRDGRGKRIDRVQQMCFCRIFRRTATCTMIDNLTVYVHGFVISSIPIPIPIPIPSVPFKRP